MALTDNLAAYWKLDETSGTRYDETANNNDLTDNNTVASATGKINSGADFESTNSEYLSIADASQSGLDLGASGGDWSVSMWINLESAVTGWQPLLSKDAGQPNRSLAIALRDVSGDNYETVQSLDGTNANTNHYRAAAGITFSTGTWYHLVFTCDISTGNIKCYRNGSLDATITGGYTSYYNSTAQVEIGSYTINALYFDGVIDEVGVWGRELSSTEVSQLYNSGAGLAYPFSTTSSIKTINGLAYASVKTVNGLAVASVKTVNGLS